MFFPFFVICHSEEAEVVSHDQIPFLQFIKHFDFLNLQPFGLIDTVVVARISTMLHLLHGVDLGSLIANPIVPVSLVLEEGILVHTN